jgi:hypothetical protein
MHNTSIQRLDSLLSVLFYAHLYFYVGVGAPGHQRVDVCEGSDAARQPTDHIRRTSASASASTSTGNSESGVGAYRAGPVSLHDGVANVQG